MRNMEIMLHTPYPGKKAGWGRTVCETLMGMLLFAGIYMSYASLLGVSAYFGQILAVGAGVILTVSVFSDRQKFFPLALIGFSLVFAVVLTAENRLVSDGLKLVANRVMELAGKAGKLSFVKFAVESGAENAAFKEACFLVFPGVILAFLCGFAVKYGKRILVCFLVFPVFLLQLLLGETPNLFFALLMVFMVLMVSSAGFMQEMEQRSGRVQLASFAAAGAVFLILALGVCLFLPSSNYVKNSFVKEIKEKAGYLASDLRYEKGKPNSFTQGNFLRLSNLELWEEPALEVTMSRPQSYYLRGFVGSVYTSEGWEELENEQIYDDYAAYYWLHKKGFGSLNQLSILEAQSVEEGEPAQVEITIDNVNANSKYLYLPYELSEDPDSLGRVRRDGDIDVASRNFAGERHYSFTASENMISRYPQVLEEIEQTGEAKKEQKEEYKKNELNYREKVYERFLEVPAPVNSLFSGLFGGKVMKKEQRVDYAEAVKFVKDYLESTITYDTQAAGVSRGKDFLTELFRNTKRGYSVHYATAAAMMFRYMGIPSRYVEGYLITPDDAEGVEAYETIQIMGMNAHAWVEIYQDGIGWIPVEMTPAYYGIMDQAEIPGGSTAAAAGGGEGLEGGGMAPQEVDPPDVAETLDQEGVDVALILRVIGCVLLILAAALLAGILLFFAVRRKRTLKRRQALFEDQDKSLAICQMLAYMEKIFAAAEIRKTGASAGTYRQGISEKWSAAYAKRYGVILEIGQKAAFSRHTMTEEELQKVAEYKDMLLLKLTDGQKWKKRMKLKYIDCLY